MKSPVLIIFYLFITFMCYGQITKDTWSLGGMVGYQHTTVPGGDLNFDALQLHPEFLFFPFERFGVGSRISFVVSRTEDILGGFDLNSSFVDVEIEPIFRYIVYQWKEGQTALFMQGSFRYGLNSRRIDFAASERETFQRWGWSLGPGLSYFLTPAVALEAQVMYRASRFLENEQTFTQEERQENGVASLVGLRFFLAGYAEEEAEVYPENFSKNNLLAGGTVTFNYDQENGFSFGFAPSLGLFLTDRLVVGLGPEISYSEGPDFDSFRWGIEPFVRYYVPFSASLQFFPLASLHYGQQKSEGTFFQTARFRTSTFRVGGGLNTFLHPNVGLEWVLLYQKDNIKQVEPGGLPVNVQDNLVMQLGIQFFLNRGLSE